MEDVANVSLPENLGIEPPPRGPSDDPLTILGFTPFNPDNLTFPSNIDLNVSSNYRSVQTGGGESTRSARTYERGTHESSISIPIRLIIQGRENNQAKVVREYNVTLDDEAIIQTSRDDCRQKGSIFSRRIECRRTTTTNVRKGFTLDLSTYYSDNTNAHDIQVAIGVRNDAGTVTYRQLEGTLSKVNRTLTTPDYIEYTDPTNLVVGVDHIETQDTTIGTAYTAAATPVSQNCRVRYCYTYYNANRDLESAPF